MRLLIISVLAYSPQYRPDAASTASACSVLSVRAVLDRLVMLFSYSTSYQTPYCRVLPCTAARKAAASCAGVACCQ